MTRELIDHLKSFATTQRFVLFNRIIDQRTRYMTVVIEDIYQPHNASAVLRSCDCFGLQDVHVIEKKNRYSPNNEITMGADKWLSIKKHSSLDAINLLKNQGYRIVATTPGSNTITPDQFNLEEGKFALCFGTELEGLSPELMSAADCHLRIPMYGFTESFNISVSVALLLSHFSTAIRKSNIDWHLTEFEKDELLLQWLKNSIKSSDLIVEKFLAAK